MRNLRFGAVLLTMVLWGAMVQAQNSTPEELIGTWEVAKVHSIENEIPANQKELVDNLKVAFEASVFNFEESGKFSFDFAFEEIQVENGHWQFSEASNSVIVKNWENRNDDGRVLMEIKIEQDAGKVYFTPAELFFTLEMERR